MYTNLKILSLLTLFIALQVSDVIADGYKIGLSAPLSGGGAGWGNDVRNVLNFANEKIASGKYSFIVEDDKCDVKTSLTIARKFIAIDKIKEVFSVCGQTMIATAPLYTESKVTSFGTLATPSQLSKLGVFRTALSDDHAAKLLAEAIRKKYTSVSVLTEENEYPVSFVRDFVDSANKLGLSVEDITFVPDQQDFRTQLTVLKSKNVKALFLNTQTEESLLNIIKQLKTLQFNPTLYGAYLPGSKHFLKIAGPLANGIMFVDFPTADEMLTDQGKKLFDEYRSRFGELEGWTYIFPSTFEAFRALHLALSSGKPVGSFLKEHSFDGIFGRYSFNTDGDIVGPKHSIRIISGENVSSIETTQNNG